MNVSRPTTEEKILAAAEREFLNKGFSSARTTAIAEAAGVTHAMLHYYFRTKEKLFAKVLDSKMETVRDIMLGSIDVEGTTLREKIEKAIAVHYDFLAANPELPRFFINELWNNGEKYRNLIQKISTAVSRVVDVIQAQIDLEARQGTCRRIDARMLLLDILSLNAFPFIAAPLVGAATGETVEGADFAAKRKKETLDMIMRKLNP